MSLPLSKETLQAAYEYLASTPPFSQWNLPAGEDIKFVVARGRVAYGWHDKKRRRPHLIAVSAAMVGQHMTLLSTMAHEMIHLYVQEARIRDTSDHGKVFRKLAAIVCKVHAFDLKTFV